MSELSVQSDNNNEFILKVVKEELYYLTDRMHDRMVNVYSDNIPFEWTKKERKVYHEGYNQAIDYVREYADKLNVSDIEDTIKDYVSNC